jgi:hypothetical protein
VLDVGSAAALFAAGADCEPGLAPFDDRFRWKPEVRPEVSLFCSGAGRRRQRIPFHSGSRVCGVSFCSGRGPPIAVRDGGLVAQLVRAHA